MKNENSDTLMGVKLWATKHKPFMVFKYSHNVDNRWFYFVGFGKRNRNTSIAIDYKQLESGKFLQPVIIEGGKQ